MPPQVSVPLLALLVVAAVLGMRRGWRRRVAATADVPVPPLAPTDAGAVLAGPFEATYVCTTRAGDWLERVASHELGVRSAATVVVAEAGVHVVRRGARDLFLPRADLRDARREPGMAGKFVGGDGLVVLRWTDGGVPLDTGLRPRRRAERDQLTAAVRELIDQQPTRPRAREKEDQ